MGIPVEVLGVPANRRRIPLARLEVLDTPEQRFGGLMRKEQAAFSILNGFQCAAFAVGENGLSAGLGF